MIGPQVFRFEYYYLLKADGQSFDHAAPSDISGIAAIVVDIAVIDPKSKVLLTNAQITVTGRAIGLITLPTWLPASCVHNWQNTLNANTTLPRPALSGIRLYERFFYLSPPTL